VGLHTHLCETVDEERYTLSTYGLRPVEFMDIVDQGRLATVDLPLVVEQHNAASLQLMDTAELG